MLTVPPQAAPAGVSRRLTHACLTVVLFAIGLQLPGQTQSANDHWTRAQRHFDSELYPQAEQDCERVLKLTSDRPLRARAENLWALALINEAQTEHRSEKFSAAEVHLRRALAEEPQLAGIHLNLGALLYKEGKIAEGSHQIQRALALTPPGQEHEQALRLLENPLRAREKFIAEFSVVAADGEPLSFASLRGRVVLFDFWATWCGPCQQALPYLKQLRQKYAAQPFRLISMATRDTEPAWRTFIRLHAMNWTQYFDRGNELAQAFSVENLPSYILIDANGTVRKRIIGWRDEDATILDEAISQLLRRNQVHAADSSRP